MWKFGAVVTALVIGMVTIPTVVAKESIQPLVLSTWKGLPTSKSSSDDYDYFPEGGLRNFWTHVSLALPIGTLEDITGVKVFKGGPHTDQLVLDSHDSFGQYNPKFVQKLASTFIPAKEDTGFIQDTQGVYNSHVQPLARTYFLVLQKLNTDTCTQTELIKYKEVIETPGSNDVEIQYAFGSYQGSYYERWYYFMNPNFCRNSNATYLSENGDDGGINGNVVKTVVGFWLRRTLDGSKDEFSKALTSLLERYDAEWLNAQKNK